ncbi:MAG: metallophosphoesterase [Bacteroidales bacterium]
MKKLLFTFIQFAFVTSIMAGTQFYRAIYRDDPSTTIDIEWCDNGASTGAMVYYDVVDHGTTYTSYTYNHGIDATTTTYSLKNEFSRITGLTPNTIYYFVIHDASGTSARMYFKTLPNINTATITFAACGDSRAGTTSGGTNTDRANNCILMGKVRPDFATFNGDFVYGGSTTNWTDWFTDWQSTLGSIGHIVPIIPVKGNHEASADIYNVFDVPTSTQYYALQIAGNLLRIYSLNSEVGGTTAVCDATEQTWLHNDLVNYTGTANEPYWKFAQWHEPFVPHCYYSANTTLSNCWAPDFLTYNVKLCCEAHAHCTKYTWPIVQSSSGSADHGFIRDDVNGTVYIGEGQFGAPFHTGSPIITYAWIRDAELTFYGFHLICVTKAKIDVRTLEEVNVTSVGQVAVTDPECTLPSGVTIWTPSNGSPLTLTYSGTLTDVPNNLQENKFLKVFPVPSSDKVTISFAKLTDDAQLEIYNSLGEEVKTVPVAIGAEFKELNIADLPIGTYNGFLKNKSGTQCCKFTRVK